MTQHYFWEESVSLVSHFFQVLHLLQGGEWGISILEMTQMFEQLVLS